MFVSSSLSILVSYNKPMNITMQRNCMFLTGVSLPVSQ